MRNMKAIIIENSQNVFQRLKKLLYEEVSRGMIIDLRGSVKQLNMNQKTRTSN